MSPPPIFFFFTNSMKFWEDFIFLKNQEYYLIFLLHLLALCNAVELALLKINQRLHSQSV